MFTLYIIKNSRKAEKEIRQVVEHDFSKAMLTMYAVSNVKRGETGLICEGSHCLRMVTQKGVKDVDLDVTAF